MPLSGSVTAGSAALASQYNNLRSDVLDTAAGHTHTGASENGAQIEGTALKATGATNGYVLTANGAGGVSFAASSGPTVSTVYGTAAFSTATNNGGTPVRYAALNAAVHYVTTTGNGSVVVAVRTPDTGSASGHEIATYTTGGTVKTGGTAWANVVAGTAWFIAAGQGFATATSEGFVIREVSKTGTTQTTTIRKFTNTLTNSWNTQLFTGTVDAGSLSEGGPFSQLNGYGASYVAGRWAAGPGIWYGNDYRAASVFSTSGTTQICSMWIINDSTGSAYSAPFGSATSGNGAQIAASVFVPSSTAATNGTIHAWGYNNASARYVTYAVGSASISAVATADYTFTGANWSNITDNFVFPIVGRIADAVWLESASRVMVTTVDTVRFLDRTLGTVLAESQDRNVVRGYNLGRNTMGNIDTGNFDPTSNIIINDGQYVTILGSYDGMAAPFNNLTQFPAGYTSTSTLCGPGSATFAIGVNSSGTVLRWDLAGYAKVQLDASSTANRLMSIQGGQGWSREMFLSVNAGGSGSDMASGGSAKKGPVNFIASGTSVVTANLAAGPDSSANWRLSATTTPQNQVVGGTAVVLATKVALA